MIRHAEQKDLPYILSIYNDAIINTTAVYSYEPHTLAMREEWFAQKMADGYPVIVFEKDERAVGFATYGPFRPWPAYQYTVEHSIYIDPAYHRQGIAKELLQAIINLAKEQQYKTMVAGIDADNQGSIALHKKFGFEHTGTLQKVGYKFERWLDLAFYQLLFEEE